MSGYGGFVHEQILLDQLEQRFEQVGATTRREVNAGPSLPGSHVDFFAEVQGKRIAVEVELSSKRIEADLRKAMSVGADELWIVVPSPSVCRSVRRKLRTMSVRPDRVGVFVLTLGLALQRVSDCLSFSSRANPWGRKETKQEGGR